jgi:REP element-mobilizing transposase RayT
MTMARGQLVDSSVTPYYHCISRCVRRAFLCGEGAEHRKQWVEDRLKELASIFAIEVCAYAVLDNHLHVILRLNDAAAASWTNEDTVRRWGKLFPPRGKDRQALEVTDAWVEDRLKDAKWIAECRKRLNDLGWFMKCVKEPLARMANREDECRGTFWEARFKSIAILDEEALLTTLAYVDMNVMAAGMAKTPEESQHTSVKARVDHCREQGILEDIVNQSPDRTRRDTTPEDESFWLVPIHERREQGGTRAGMSAHMSLASYLRLLDWSSRLFRPGKVRIPADVAGILERLSSSVDLWHQRLKKLRETERLYGVVFAVSRESVFRFAESKGVSRAANTAG